METITIERDNEKR